MLWLNAAAFAGLALVALPLAIHLLVRQHTRTMAFPSLRFVRETALSAFRRRTLEDAWLLAVRVGVMAAAVAALAAPVLDTAARRQSYAGRVSRATIALDGTPDLDALRRDAFRSASFSRFALADAIDDAIRWLNAQPPSAREVVIAGELRRGAVFDSDLLDVPSDIGLRFVQSSHAQDVTATLAVPILTRRDGKLVLLERVVRAAVDSTQVLSETVTPAQDDSVRVTAAARDQPLADAALAAALREGLPWPRDRAPIVIVWDGGVAPPGEAQILKMSVPASAAAAPEAIWQTLTRAAGPPVEPWVISREQLDRWSRAPGPPDAAAQPEDAGDRRWLWVAALLLLGVEQWLRR